MSAKFTPPYRALTAGDLRRWLDERKTAVPDNEEVKVGVQFLDHDVTDGASLMRVEIKNGQMCLTGGWPVVEEKFGKKA